MDAVGQGKSYSAQQTKTLTGIDSFSNFKLKINLLQFSCGPVLYSTVSSVILSAKELERARFKITVANCTVD